MFCLGEFLRVFTHPRLVDPPHSTKEACDALARFLSLNNVVVIRPGPEYPGRLVEANLEGQRNRESHLRRTNRCIVSGQWSDEAADRRPGFRPVPDSRSRAFGPMSIVIGIQNRRQVREAGRFVIPGAVFSIRAGQSHCHRGHFYPLFGLPGAVQETGSEQGKREKPFHFHVAFSWHIRPYSCNTHRRIPWIGIRSKGSLPHWGSMRQISNR